MSPRNRIYLAINLAAANWRNPGQLFTRWRYSYGRVSAVIDILNLNNVAKIGACRQFTIDSRNAAILARVDDNNRPLGVASNNSGRSTRPSREFMNCWREGDGRSSRAEGHGALRYTSSCDIAGRVP